MAIYPGYPSRASVRITHLPTGITEDANGYRSQRANRDACLARLRSKLAVGHTHPLPMRATYELPDGVEAPDRLDEYREDTQ